MFREIANTPSERQPDQVIKIGRTPHGLNTFDPPDRLSITESSKLLNWMIAKGGEKIPRLPISLYSNSATTNPITYIKRVNIGGTTYELVVDSGYRLYYLDGSLDPTLIGTLEGDATVLNYNGIVMIFDGSYIKYIDGVSTIKMAYDSSGYQFDYTSNLQNDSLDSKSVVAARIAQKFTTGSWDAGYRIPFVEASFYLRKVGSPISAVTVTCYIQRVSDGVLSGPTQKIKAADLGTAYQEITFINRVQNDFFSPNTDYYIQVIVSYSTASEYVEVACTTNSTSTGLAYYGVWPSGAWTLDNTKDVVCSVKPSAPPKAKYGTIWNNRPWVWGDPDNLGVMHFGNLTHLDWSTVNGGGSLGIIDDSGDAYEVGDAAPFYNDLYVFGVESQPYLVKISGSEPENYTQNAIFNEPWAPQGNIVNSVNELWFANSNGVSPLSGVNEYGDLRSRTASDQIYDKIRDYWDSSTSFCGYYPRDGQLWLVMPTYHRILVCHTKLGVQGPDQSGVWFPWSEYEYYRYDLTSSEYKWIANGDEYYLQIAAGGDPSISAQPDFIVMDGVVLTEGTAGSLSDHQWDYAQDPGAAYNTIYIKDATGDPDTSGVDIKAVFIPTCLEQSGSNMLMGGSDKYIYKIDPGQHKDMGSIQIKPVWASAYIEMPGGYSELNKVQVLASTESSGGSTIDINFKFDRSYAKTGSITATLPESGNTAQEQLYEYISFDGWSFLVETDNVELGGPIHDDGLLIWHRGLR